jgi:hypothetical protein
MRKGGFAALSRYGGATTVSADFTDQVLNRRKQSHEDYGPLVAIRRTALISCVICCSEMFVRGALPFDFASGKLGGALLDPCYQCNPWLIAFRRERGNDFFEARLASERIPPRHQFQFTIADVAGRTDGDGNVLAGEIFFSNPRCNHREVSD